MIQDAERHRLELLPRAENKTLMCSKVDFVVGSLLRMLAGKHFGTINGAYEMK